MRSATRLILLASALAAIAFTLPVAGPPRVIAEPPARQGVHVVGTDVLRELWEAPVDWRTALDSPTIAETPLDDSAWGIFFSLFGFNGIQVTTRPLTPKEQKLRGPDGEQLIQFPIGRTAVVIVVHPSNTRAGQMTMDQVRKVYAADAPGAPNAKRWSDLAPGWPDKEIVVFSGTPFPGPEALFTEPFVEAVPVGRSDLVKTTEFG